MLDVLLLLVIFLAANNNGMTNAAKEENWGDGLHVLTTYKPKDCQFMAQSGDVVHYHYVGRLADGQIFGRSFDYDSPYIVTLGEGRIIPGMDRGLVGTCLWERRRIKFLSHLGYGERGVGNLIPPNATLIFYIRLIKLERDGQSLGTLPKLKDVWEQGLAYYSNNEHHQAIEYFERSLDIFGHYQKVVGKCLHKCGKIDFQSNLGTNTILIPDVISNQFIQLSLQGQCMKDCKGQNLTQNSQPDSETLELFQKRIPYSYLQFSYYQIGELEEGIKCALTFFFYHPNNSMILNSLDYLRKKLQWSKDNFTAREPGLQAHHEHYLKGKEAYQSGEWLKSIEKIESALIHYNNTLKDCLLLCDDSVYVNMTWNERMQKFAHLKFSPNLMEYYTLLQIVITDNLKCHIECYTWMDTVNGQYFDKYLAGHFHHLQYNYYKANLLNKAAEAASTFQVLEPSDTIMAKNIKLFRSNLNVSPDKFKPREDISKLQREVDTKRRLLKFSITGEQKKRQGSRGDKGLLHEEL